MCPQHKLVVTNFWVNERHHGHPVHVEAAKSRVLVVEELHLGGHLLAVVQPRVDHVVLAALSPEEGRVEVRQGIGPRTTLERDHGDGHILLPRHLNGHALVQVRRRRLVAHLRRDDVILHILGANTIAERVDGLPHGLLSVL
jgi:hypothetical protein